MRILGPIAIAIGMLLAATAANAGAAAEFDGLLHAFVQDRFAAEPVMATSAGVHDFDDRMPDVTLEGHAAAVRMLRDYLGRFEKIETAGLTPIQRDDLELTIASIKSALLEEEQVQAWKIDPDHYATLATNGVFVLIERDFAPIESRLRSVVGREKRIPAILAAAEKILADPAPVYVEIARLQIDGNIDFFSNDLPQAFAAVKDPAAQAAFKSANGEVIRALRRYKAFLRRIVPKAHADFALGAERYRLKLLYDEMIDTPIDAILAAGRAQLRRDQAALIETARKIDPDKSVEAVIADLGKDHVGADALIPTAQAQLKALRQFLIDRRIISIVGDAEPKVAETPSFMRATTFASMDPPGPLESVATEAYYFITLPDPRWSAAKQEEYLQSYNTPLLQNVSVHEVWPGHFVQYLFERNGTDRSLARELFNGNSTVEGWAHYAEQMVLDEGLGGGDPKLRLAQLIDALLRDCRLIVGISLHTKGMTLDDARAFFLREGHQAKVVGQTETYRGTQDPTYLVYTFGKLAILKLREDYRAKMGPAFSLQDFHDRFNRAGQIPVKLIRREMMGEDGPLL